MPYATQYPTKSPVDGDHALGLNTQGQFVRFPVTSLGGGGGGSGTVGPDLTVIEALDGTGYLFRLGAEQWELRAGIPWGSLTGIPASFAPSAHQHAITDVTSLQAALDAKQAADGDLTALAALSTTGVVRRTGADAFTAGPLPLGQIEQAGATTGQAIVWNGSAWVPQAVAASGASFTEEAKTTSTAESLLAARDKVLLRYTNAAAVTLTVGSGSADLPAGWEMIVEVGFGAGPITFAGAASTVPITLRRPTASLTTLAGPARVRLRRVAAQTVEITGDLVPDLVAPTDVMLPGVGLLGRDTAGSGASAAITLSAAFSLTGGLLDLANAGIAPAKIAQGGATTGQVLAWNGSAWAPAAGGSGGGIGDFDALPSIAAGPAGNALVVAVSADGTESKALGSQIRAWPSGTISGNTILLASQGFTTHSVTNAAAQITVAGDMGDGWATTLSFHATSPTSAAIVAGAGITLEDEWGRTTTSSIAIAASARLISIQRVTATLYRVFGAATPPKMLPADIAQAGATNGQALVWNGSAWAPASVSGGSGTTDYGLITDAGAPSVRPRRGTTVQHATFTGLQYEFTLDSTKQTLVVHDGSTAGGFPLQREIVPGRNVTITGQTVDVVGKASDYLSVTAARNLVATDNGRTLEDDGTARTLTAMPGLGKGFFCRLHRQGAGNLTLQRAAGVTFVPNNPASVVTTAQYDEIFCECIADNGSAATFRVRLVPVG